MGSLKVVLLSVLAAVTYGVLHDQVTARVCVEYFTVAHPRLFQTEDPTLLALGWGIISTWWVGLLLGLPLALIARVGPGPKLAARDLLGPLAALMLCTGLAALLAGVAGSQDGRVGSFRLAVVLLELPAERHAAFTAVARAHRAAYAAGVVGAWAVWAWAGWRRQRLAPRAGRPGTGRVAWCAVGAAAVPFVFLSAYLLMSRGVLLGSSAAGDWWAGGVSLAAGVACVYGVPLPAEARGLVVVLYALVMGPFLLTFGLYFVGVVYGHWV